MGEEVIYAGCDHVHGEQTRALEVRGCLYAVVELEAVPLRSQVSLPLGLPQLGYDLRPTALRALFLRDGVVRARQPGGRAVLACLGAISNALHLPPMTRVAGALDRRRSRGGGVRHGAGVTRECWQSTSLRTSGERVD